MLFLTILASSVAFVDMTIVNLALPVMQVEMSASFQSMQWVVEAYVLMLCALMLTGGGLADTFGRRRILLLGASIFLVASVAAALAATAEWLIAARALQGVGGALLAPASLALVSSSFAPAERGKALGLWAAFSGIATAFAPPLGGLLIEWSSWRAVFYINVPILAVVLLFAPLKLKESSEQRAPGARTDWLGAVLAVVTLLPLTFALIHAGAYGMSDGWVWLSAGLSLGAGTGFIYWERRVSTPMLPLAIFRSRAFSGLNVMTIVIFTAIGAVMFFLPMVLMQAFHYSPAEAGLALVPSMVAMFVLAPWSGKFADQFGPRLPITIGPLISATSFVWFAHADMSQYVAGALFPILVMGAGFGTWVTPLTSAVMTAAGERNAGIASGINNAAARLAQLLAIAVLGLVASISFNAALDQEFVALALPAEWIAAVADDRVRLGGMVAPEAMSPAMQTQFADAVAAAFRQAFGTVTTVAACLCVLAGAFGLWSVRHLRGQAATDTEA